MKQPERVILTLHLANMHIVDNIKRTVNIHRSLLTRKITRERGPHEIYIKKDSCNGAKNFYNQ